MSNSSNLNPEQQAQLIAQLLQLLMETMDAQGYTPSDFMAAIPFIIAQITRKLDDSKYVELVDTLREDLIDTRNKLKKAGVW